MIRDGWQENLLAWYEKNQARNFLWGEFDCCIGWLDAIFHINDNPELFLVYEFFYQKYNSAKSALAFYNSEFDDKATSPINIGMAVLGAILNKIDPAIAKRGDALIIEYDGVIIGALMSVYSGYVWVISEENGIISVPFASVKILMAFDCHG